MSDNSTNPDQPLKVAAGKSAYTPPRLTRFGPVQGLTLGSGGPGNDGAGGRTGIADMTMGMNM